MAIESINAYYTTKAMYDGKLRVTGVPLSDSKQLIAVAMRKDNAALIAEGQQGYRSDAFRRLARWDGKEMVRRHGDHCEAMMRAQPPRRCAAAKLR